MRETNACLQRDNKTKTSILNGSLYIYTFLRNSNSFILHAPKFLCVSFVNLILHIVFFSDSTFSLGFRSVSRSMKSLSVKLQSPSERTIFNYLFNNICVIHKLYNTTSGVNAHQQPHSKPHWRHGETKCDYSFSLYSLLPTFDVLLLSLSVGFRSWSLNLLLFSVALSRTEKGL